MLASRYVLPRAFGWMSVSLEALFILSLCWCFAFVLAAQAMGLSLEIGAFLAGIALAQLPYNHELRRRVHPLMNFFIAIFFVSLGLQMQLAEAGGQWLPALVLSLFVLIGNPLIFLLIIAGLGYDVRTSFMTSVTVAQISEFSFIFAAMGVSAALIGDPILSLVAVIGLVTIGVSSFMILYNERQEISGPRDRGWDERPRARILVDELLARGETVLAIDTDPRSSRSSPAPPSTATWSTSRCWRPPTSGTRASSSPRCRSRTPTTSSPSAAARRGCR
jgi:hypothetical protein